MNFRKTDIKIKRSIFFKLILPYICVLLIPALLWVASNTYIIRNTETRTAKIVRDNIENAVKKIDSNLEQMEYVVYLVSNDKMIEGFFDKKYLTYEDKMKYRNLLSAYSIGNGLMKEIYLYSKSSETLVTQNDIFNSPERFFESGYAFEGITREEWAENLRNGSLSVGYAPVMNRRLSSSVTEQILPYTRSIPIDNPGKNKGVVGISINEAGLLEGFKPIIADGQGGVFVFDKKGRLIMSEGRTYVNNTGAPGSFSGQYKKIKLDGKNIFNYVYTSEKNQWQYNCYVSEAYVLSEITKVNFVLNTINILALILGIIVCVYFTFIKNKSYMQIINMLNIANESSTIKFRFDEFYLLKQHLGELVKDNKSKKDIISDAKAWNALLSGNYTDEIKLQELCSDSTLEFTHEKFVVIVLDFPTHNSEAKTGERNLFLKQLFEKYLTEDFYIYSVNIMTSVIILNYDIAYENLAQILKQQIAKMNIEVFYKSHSDIMIGVGLEASSLTDIYISYNQACKVIRYNRIVGTNYTLLYDELPNQETMYYYPIDIETKFISAIENGKTEDVINLINLIYKKNFEDLKLPLKHIERLFGEILSTINKLKLSHFGMDEAFEGRPEFFTVKNFFDYLRDYVFATCENIKFLNDESKDIRFEKMLKWVEENYQDSTLSLVSVGERFNISSTGYLSMKFKEVANETFSSYLERIRIENACSMLLRGVKVKEVSEKVGYMSDISFRRAFKKRIGVSPKEYVINAITYDDKQKN